MEEGEMCSQHLGREQDKKDMEHSKQGIVLKRTLKRYNMEQMDSEVGCGITHEQEPGVRGPGNYQDNSKDKISEQGRREVTTKMAQNR